MYVYVHECIHMYVYMYVYRNRDLSNWLLALVIVEAWQIQNMMDIPSCWRLKEES